MLKSLREAELEDEVYALKREVYLLKTNNANSPSFTYDYSKVEEIQLCEQRELLRVAKTTFSLNHVQDTWQMEAYSLPKKREEGYSYSYYLDRDVVYSTHYLEQVLVAQHEKIIRLIMQSRNK